MRWYGAATPQDNGNPRLDYAFHLALPWELSVSEALEGLPPRSPGHPGPEPADGSRRVPPPAGPAGQPPGPGGSDPEIRDGHGRLGLGGLGPRPQTHPRAGRLRRAGGLPRPAGPARAGIPSQPDGPHPGTDRRSCPGACASRATAPGASPGRRGDARRLPAPLPPEQRESRLHNYTAT